jgi:hypothetical protein
MCEILFVWNMIAGMTLALVMPQALICSGEFTVGLGVLLPKVNYYYLVSTATKMTWLPLGIGVIRSTGASTRVIAVAIEMSSAQWELAPFTSSTGR